jgi:hypothetical protein
MNENDLRDCFAMLKGITGASPVDCYEFADAMLEVRKWKEFEQENGIAAFKPKRNTSKKVPNAK